MTRSVRGFRINTVSYTWGTPWAVPRTTDGGSGCRPPNLVSSGRRSTCLSQSSQDTEGLPRCAEGRPDPQEEEPSTPSTFVPLPLNRSTRHPRAPGSPGLGWLLLRGPERGRGSPDLTTRVVCGYQGRAIPSTDRTTRAVCVGYQGRTVPSTTDPSGESHRETGSPKSGGRGAAVLTPGL